MAIQRRAICTGVLVGIGVVVAVLGVVVTVVVVPGVVHKTVKGMVRLGLDDNNNYTDTTSKWAKPPFPITMLFYFFNTTNPESVAMGEKPNLVEIGPYGFVEVDEKFMVNFSADQRTVTFRNRKTYTFDRSLSCADCYDTDLFTVPNALLLTVSEMMRQKNAPVWETLLIWNAMQFENEDLFVTKNVSDLLFVGYEDPLLDIVQNPIVKIIIQKYFPNMTDLPKRVAFFYGQNGTDDGLYKIVTGAHEDDLSNLGEILEWKNKTVLPEKWWSTPQARAINGSDGTMYPPFLTTDDKLHMFVSQVCRSLYITPVKTENPHRVDYDIPTIRFTLPAEVFDPGLPENQGFCGTHDDHYYPSQLDSNCLPKGLMDVSRCQPGNPPIAVSLPHFMFAPHDVQQSVNGMRPQLERHSTYVDLEPTTAVGVYMSRRLQINVKMHNVKGFGDLGNVKSVLIPVLWLNESAVIDFGPDSTHHQIYHDLVQTLNIAYPVCYAVIGLGALFVVTGLVGVLVLLYEQHTVAQRRVAHKDGDHQSLENNEEPPAVDSPSANSPASRVRL